MLQALLLAALVAAPLGSAALFVPARLIDRGTGAWSAVRRFMLAVIGTAVLAAAAAGVLRLLGATEHNLVAGAAVHLPFASLTRTRLGHRALAAADHAPSASPSTSGSPTSSPSP